MKGPDKTHLPLRRKTVTHTTGYLRMKDDSARKFLASILTLVVDLPLRSTPQRKRPACRKSCYYVPEQSKNTSEIGVVAGGIGEQ